jgi:hypothetical protein
MPEGMGYPQGGAAPPEAAAAPGGPEQAAPERGTEIAQVLERTTGSQATRGQYRPTVSTANGNANGRQCSTTVSAAYRNTAGYLNPGSWCGKRKARAIGEKWKIKKS